MFVMEPQQVQWKHWNLLIIPLGRPMIGMTTTSLVGVLRIAK